MAYSTKIYITDDYWIETDPYNFILKHEKPTIDIKTRALTGKTTQEVVGYYRSIEAVAEGYLKDVARVQTKDFVGTLGEYVGFINEVMDKAIAEVKIKIEEGVDESK